MIALLVIGMTSTASAQVATAKGKGGTPEVEMGVFVDYGLVTAQAKPPYNDTEDDYQIRQGLTWASLPIMYYIEAGVTEAKITAINAGFSAWEADPESAMDYTYGGTISGADSGVNKNEKNTVAWRDLGDTGPVAATYYWYYPSLKQIIEFDIVLNSAYDWSTSGELGNYDVWNVVAHEARHTLVLYDLYPRKDAWLTMYGYTWPSDTLKRDLGYGDRLGVRELYPLP